MREEQFFDTLSLIHEAAFNPSGWGSVLRRMAELTECVAGGLTQEDPSTGQGTPITYFGFDTGHVARTFDHYLPMNPLFKIAPRMLPGLIVSNGDVVTLDVFRRSEFYNGWARPQGLCSPITLVTHRARGKYIPLTLVKPDGGGDASLQDRAIMSRCAPHLIHAMQVTLRLQMVEVQQNHLGLALAALSDGALLVDGQGKVVFANAAAEALLGGLAGRSVSVSQGKLVAYDTASNNLLQTTLASALTKEGPSQGVSVSIRSRRGLGQLKLIFAPLPYTSKWEAVVETEYASCPKCLILISDGGVSVLARTYRLTYAETRLVEAVVGGKGLSWSARALGISRATAQTHLANVFQKTGTNRQAELVSLMHERPTC